MIRWYINKLHVSTPDAEIAQDIGSRAIRGGATNPFAVIGFIAHALEIHHENQAQYATIMGNLA